MSKPKALKDTKGIIAQPWDRLADETLASYSMFQRFLLSAPPRKIHTFAATEESMTAVAIDRLANRHSWHARASAWDAHIMAEATKAAETKVQTYGERAADALAQMQIDRTLARARMLKLARECLDRLKPEDLKPSDALLIIDLDAKLSKLDQGLPTEIVEVRAKRDAREVANLPEEYKDRIRFGGEWWEDVLEDYDRDRAEGERASSRVVVDITPEPGQGDETGELTGEGETPEGAPDPE